MRSRLEALSAEWPGRCSPAGHVVSASAPLLEVDVNSRPSRQAQVLGLVRAGRGPAAGGHGRRRAARAGPGRPGAAAPRRPRGPAARRAAGPGRRQRPGARDHHAQAGRQAPAGAGTAGLRRARRPGLRRHRGRRGSPAAPHAAAVAESPGCRGDVGGRGREPDGRSGRKRHGCGEHLYTAADARSRLEHRGRLIERRDARTETHDRVLVARRGRRQQSAADGVGGDLSRRMAPPSRPSRTAAWPSPGWAGR